MHAYTHTQTDTHTETETQTHRERERERDTHAYTHTRTHIHTHIKMAEMKEDLVESALNMLVSVTEKSGNLRNDLKNGILKAVRTLRKSIVSIRKEVEEKNEIISNLEAKAVEANDTIHVLTEERNNVVMHAAPSIGGRGRFVHGGWLQ